MKKVYLGDSVYCEYEFGGLRLTTENGIGSPSNTIFLESEVWSALKEYVENLQKETERGRDEFKEKVGGV